jgi:hypothetical protein
MPRRVINKVAYEYKKLEQDVDENPRDRNALALMDVFFLTTLRWIPKPPKGFRTSRDYHAHKLAIIRGRLNQWSLGVGARRCSGLECAGRCRTLWRREDPAGMKQKAISSGINAIKCSNSSVTFRELKQDLIIVCQEDPPPPRCYGA